MAEATFTENAVPVCVQHGGQLIIGLDTNDWSIQLKAFRNDQYDTVTLNRTAALAALGDGAKVAFQNIIDDFITAAIQSATGVSTITRAKVRAQGINYNVDAAPQE